ncbi:MAG: insulinase family protein [Pseudomonadota bacterium]
MPNRLFLLSLLLLLAPIAVAETATFAHERSDLKPDSAVRYGVLDNGMRYALMANDTPPGTASLRLLIGVGSLMEDDDQRGLAHFVEHMAFNGTTNVPEGKMVKILERLGLAFGPDTNASTGLERTVYQLELPRVDDETLGTALFLLREVAGNVTFGADAIDRERGVIASELRSRDSPAYRARRDELGYLLPGMRVVARDVGGDLDVIENAPRQRFVDLYQAWYRPERAALVVVGDLEIDDIEARIKRVFGDWEGVGEPGVEPERGGPAERTVSARIFSDAGVTERISFSLVRPWRERPDSVAARREGLVDALAYGALNRRIVALAREADAPFLGGGYGVSSVAETAEISSADFALQPGRWPEAVGVIERELRRALIHGFTAAELTEQVANFRTALRNAAEAAATRTTPGLAQGITGSLAQDRVFTHPAANRDNFEAQVATIGLDELLAALRDDWIGDDTLIHFATAQEAPEATALIQAWADSKAVSVEPPADGGARTLAYESFGEPGAVTDRSAIDDLGAEQLTFANGVRLNLKQTDFKDNQVLLSMRLGGGKAALPDGLAGLDSLVNFSYVAGGLEAHSADEIQRLIAGRAVSINASLGESVFSFSGATTPEDVALQLRLWTAFLVAPGWRPEAHAQYLRVIDGIYDTIDATPGGVLRRDLARLLRSGDVRYGVPARAVLEARTVAEMQGFLTPILAGAPIEITAVGDLEPQAIIEAVARTAGALPERPPPVAFEALTGAAFPDPASLRLTHRGQPNQALLAVFWPTGDGLDEARRQQLRLLQRVAQLRVTEEVRENLGASYSPGVTSVASRLYAGYGYFGVQSEVEAGETERMVATLAAVIEGIGEQPVTADELLRARQPLLEGLETSLETNPYWLAVLSASQSRPEVLDIHRESRSRIEAVTPDELTALASEFLKAETRYAIEVVPAAGEAAGE